MNLTHKYFVQHMMRKCMSTKEAAFRYYLSLIEKAGRMVDGQDDKSFVNFVNVINTKITKQFFKLVFIRCEVTGKELLLFINMKSDEFSKLQVYFSKKELEYFQTIMQEILQTDNHRITFMMCLNLASTLSTHFTKEAGQNVLEKWLKQGYYVKELDYIYLGPTLISEFTGYLRAHYPNNVCSLCSELVFTGKKCNSCHKMAHSHCLETFRNQNKCPSCQTEWTEERSLTQESANTDDSQDEGNSSNTLGPQMRKRRRLVKK